MSSAKRNLAATSYGLSPRKSPAKRQRLTSAFPRGGVRGGGRAKPMTMILQRQVKKLLAGATKDAVTIVRTDGDVAGIGSAAALSRTQYASFCPTSSNASAGDFVGGAAVATGGVVVTDGDQFTVNKLVMQVRFKRGAVFDAADGAALIADPPRARLIMVQFREPATLPSAGGTLPPVTEVLESADIDALFLSKDNNGNRFAVLEDREYNLGFLGGGATTFGDGNQMVSKGDFIDLKVGKVCHLSEAASDDTPTGGFATGVPHVNKGLIVCYLLGSGPAAVYGPGATQPGIQWASKTRVNYTSN